MTCETMEEALNGTPKVILKDPAAVAFNQELERRGWSRSTSATLQSSLAMTLHEPRHDTHRLASTPLLMVVSENDKTIQTAGNVFSSSWSLSDCKSLKVLAISTHIMGPS
jgi:hypothetical protein